MYMCVCVRSNLVDKLHFLCSGWIVKLVVLVKLCLFPLFSGEIKVGIIWLWFVLKMAHLISLIGAC